MVKRPVFTPPPWYTGETAEQIQARMMNALPADIDNVEGGFPYDFTMPTALEVDELINFVLIETLKIMFPAWSYGQYMDYHAAGVGLTRRAPNHASGTVTVRGVPGTQIPKGSVFCVPAVGDTPAIEYATDMLAIIGTADPGEDYGTVGISVTAVEGGITGNVSQGTIVIMASPIEGVVRITNEAAVTGGTAEETDDELYERILLAEQSAGAGDCYVGCAADYIRWAKSCQGVGTVLVDANYEEEHPGHVKLIVLDGNGQPANQAILDDVYDYIMAPGRPLERLAPVGAALVVVAPGDDCKLDIVITGLVISDASTQADIATRFVAALAAYYVEAKEEHAVKYNRVHAIFTGVSGVGDFATLTINGTAANIEIDDDDYPVTRKVTINGTDYPEG